MDFRELQYVLAIQKYGNISKASNALYMTQPALSRFLQNLENELGAPVFKRLGNKYILTYAGERYVEYARQILNIKKELDLEISDIVHNNTGILKVGFPTMRAAYMLPCTLPVFHERYPNVKLAIHEANSETLTEMIVNGDIDLAFYNYFESHPNVGYSVISNEEILLVMSRKNPLADKGVLIEESVYPHMNLKEVKHTGIIFQMPGQRTRQSVERLLKREKIEPNIVLQTANITAGYELAAENYGVFFITDTHLKHMPGQERIVCFSIGNPRTTVDFVAAYRKNSYIPFHAEEYMKIVRDFT